LFGIREKILVVDDNKDICEAILMAFEGDLDKECFLAANGKEALQILEQFDIQVVITDLNMPEMGGLEFIKKMREQKIESTVIVISGEKKSKEFKELLPLGVTQFFEKPFQMESLLETTQAELNKKVVKEVESALLSQMAKGRGYDFEYADLNDEKKVKFLLSFVSRDISDEDEAA
jgi:DNA-binding NtrC family response regulator